jgi:hypothetical protein
MNNVPQEDLMWTETNRGVTKWQLFLVEKMLLFRSQILTTNSKAHRMKQVPENSCFTNISRVASKNSQECSKLLL